MCCPGLGAGVRRGSCFWRDWRCPCDTACNARAAGKLPKIGMLLERCGSGPKEEGMAISKKPEISRRGFNSALLGTALAGSTGAKAWAQGAYPSRAVRLMVPYPAAGAADLLARTFGQALSEQRPAGRHREPRRSQWHHRFERRRQGRTRRLHAPSGQHYVSTPSTRLFTRRCRSTR